MVLTYLNIVTNPTVLLLRTVIQMCDTCNLYMK